MSYGDLAEKKDSIEISDCEYESLLELIRFIYSDKANLTPDNVMQMMCLAKKYMLPSLADKCSAFLQENLDTSNVFHVLPAAQKYEEKDLLEHCWKVIETETAKAVKSDGFVTIERSVLEELIDNDSLNIKEVELLKAVDCWAENECEKQGLVPEGFVKRRILGERVVKGIRFPVMEENEFARVVLDCGILTHKECFDLMKYFNSVLNTPVGFSEVKRAGYLNELLNVMCSFRSLNKGWPYYSISKSIILLSLDKNIKLHAVRLFGSENSEYAATLTVTILNGPHVATEKGNFSSKQLHSAIGDYHGFYIVFKPAIALKAYCDYMFDAKIDGPPSWYGQSGRSGVKHSGVTFYFVKFPDTETSVEMGQFSEFVFTLV